jgi:exopolysaccharide biosynthesis polyprenyl glycosylphosphotransferase
VIPNRRQFVKYIAKAFDLCVLIACFIFAAFVVYSSANGVSFGGFMALRIKLSNCLLFALLLTVWHNLFILCGVYVSKRLTTLCAEILGVCKATALASAFLLFLAKASHIGIVKHSFVLAFWVTCTCVMVSGRLGARQILLALRRRGRNTRFMLIVGTNERALEFARLITRRRELGYKIVGIVDDDWTEIRKLETTGHTNCCTFSGLAAFLRHNVVDEAVIFLPLQSYYQHATQLVPLWEHHGIATRFDSQLLSLKSSCSPSEEFEASSDLLVVGRAETSYVVGKRIIDCVISLLLLILLTPLFLVVAALIKCTSPGPVFFRQIRMGLNKRQFRIYKFRTMIANAEHVQAQLLGMNEMTGPVFKIKNDPRITPVGRFLRKTSIDEVPQLLNVLSGDMSLVGPRAMSLRDYQLFDRDWHRRRFSVKPGITCLWQVNGRNSVPFERWMELDMQYIDNWSLWLDLKILARTVPAVLRGTGAA